MCEVEMALQRRDSFVTNIDYKRVANLSELRALLTFCTSLHVDIYFLTTYSFNAFKRSRYLACYCSN